MEHSPLGENSESGVVNKTITETSDEDSELLQHYAKSGMQMLMNLIKDSNNLQSENWDFYTTFPAFNSLVGNESQKILQILNTIFQHQQIRGNIIRRDNEEKFDLLIEANDSILERVDSNLDELQGLKKNPEPVVGKIRAIRRDNALLISKNGDNASQKSKFQNNVVQSLITTRLNVRPQIKFKDKIDNRNIPFEPRIKEKPNSLKPLSVLIEKYDDKGESFSHPYEYELDLFKPPEEQLKACDPQKPKPLAEVPLIYVKDEETLNEMMDHLKKHKEIAVDLEHHSYRSFQGFTCLVQISTRDHDYIVDALELRHKLYVLNEVFTDPKVVKVFHGAEHDIEWLQRDFSVYVVNMFDTHQAAQVLNFPRLSLAYLLKEFVDITCNKQFQLYDWRTRPLSDEAVRYAREDTHYLLYIYDKLKNILIEKCQNKSSLLESVIIHSTDICKRKYWKNILTDDSHMEFYRKSKKMFDNRQMYALKHIYQWRDKVARDEDESIMYVLPNHMLLNIAENLPREVQGISALCNPVPPLVKQNEREIHKIILKAKEQSLVKPIIEGEPLNQSLHEMQPNWIPVNVDSKLYCPHDLSHSDDFRKNLPTLLLNNIGVTTSVVIEKNKFATDKSVINVLRDNEVTAPEWNSGLLKGKERQWKFVSPYQRYQKVIAFVQSEENKAIEKNNKQADSEDGPSPAKIAKHDVLDESQQIADNSSNINNRTNDEVVLEKNFEESVELESNVNSNEESVSNIDHGKDCQLQNFNTESYATKKKKKRKKKDVDMNTEKSDPHIIPQTANNAANLSCNENFVAENEIVIPNLRQSDDKEELDEKNDKNDKNVKNSKKKKSDEKHLTGETDNKRPRTKDLSFQPYNYNEVDFSKFQSNNALPKQHSKAQNLSKSFQGRRTPWLGNKKTIKKTMGNLKK
ncbi:exosome component Rrp6 [Lycorma delicatula]|uniref:exosome component Rrp6 n=1 Tax=Lycorma delicatula TaxID=130591 RepID=UPI003F511B8A